MNTPIQTSVWRVRKHLLAKFSRSFAAAMSLIAVALVCFELLPTAYAVRPTPSPSATPSPTATAIPTPSGEDRGSNNSAAESVDALNINTTGLSNTAHGWHALSANTAGGENTANGFKTLFNNTTGSYNTADGVQALEYNTTGSGNIALGFTAGSGVTRANNVISIGIAGQDVSDSCYIGRIFGATSSGGTAVFVNADGRLGTATSSKRFKEDIKPMNDASEALFAFKPVTFRYKKEIDRNAFPQFGLIAEDVADVNPQLVVRDKEGKVNTVRYEQINAMLLNEFLKEHKKVEEQQVTISDLKKDLGVLTAQLKEQATEIQKVSAQVEMRRPLTRVARSYP